MNICATVGMLYTLVSSARLASPRPHLRSLRCSCVLANVIVVAALLRAGLSVSENLNCPNIRYEFSLLHWPHFHVPSLAWQQCGRCFLCSSALHRTISLKSAQISYFVLTVPSYPDQVPVTPISHQTGVCLHTTLLLWLCERNLTVKRHLLKLETTRENKLSLPRSSDKEL